MNKHRLEFVSIDLNLDLKEEIEKETQHISDEIKVYMQDLLQSKLKPQKKSKSAEKIFWHDKFEILLDKMMPDKVLTKYEFINELEIEPDQLGPTVQRFKHFLKTRRGGCFALNIEVRSKERYYSLRKLD